jgi:hypothetical protein
METQRLAQLIDARHGLLVELRQLAERQADLIREGDMGRLFSLLAVKQGRLNELVRVDRQLDPFRAENPDDRCWHAPGARESCRELVARSAALLEEITRIERTCESDLIQRRDATAAVLQGMHQGSQATQAYGSMEMISGSQFDMSCEK